VEVFADFVDDGVLVPAAPAAPAPPLLLPALPFPLPVSRPEVLQPRRRVAEVDAVFLERENENGVNRGCRIFLCLQHTKTGKYILNKNLLNFIEKIMN
jgi:hypothetical protein